MRIKATVLDSSNESPSTDFHNDHMASALNTLWTCLSFVANVKANRRPSQNLISEMLGELFQRRGRRMTEIFPTLREFTTRKTVSETV